MDKPRTWESPEVMQVTNWIGRKMVEQIDVVSLKDFEAVKADRDAYKVMEDTLKAIGPLDTEPDKTEAAESVEAAMRISRNKWRAFSTNEDGGCHETPDEVYATAFEDGSKYTALLSADSNSGIQFEGTDNCKMCRTTQLVAKERIAELEIKLERAETGRTLAHQEAERRLSEWSKCQGRISELETQLAEVKR